MPNPLWIPAALLLLTGTSPRDDSVPEDVRGFSGQVTGTVVARHDDGTFGFKVRLVTRVWKDNRATNIEWLLGRTLRIGPRWEKGDDGEWRRNELHARFIASLEEKVDLRLEIRFAERDRFAILELSAAQRASARRGEQRPERRDARSPKLPEAVRGFSGLVGGIVRAKHDDGTVAFEVVKVLEVWKGSKAAKPESLAGLTVRVGPRWEKGEDGRWRPCKAHAEFIRRLERGEDYRIEIKNFEADHFNILELSKEQRGGR